MTENVKAGLMHKFFFQLITSLFNFLSKNVFRTKRSLLIYSTK